MADILSPEFWQKGGRATKYGQAGVVKLVADFSDALNMASSDNSKIEI